MRTTNLRGIKTGKGQWGFLEAGWWEEVVFAELADEDRRSTFDRGLEFDPDKEQMKFFFAEPQVLMKNPPSPLQLLERGLCLIRYLNKSEICRADNGMFKIGLHLRKLYFRCAWKIERRSLVA